MNRVFDLATFRQLLHVTVMCAPDKFPVRDFLKPEQQLTLESAYRDLSTGLAFVEKRVQSAEIFAKVQGMLAESLMLYRDGNNIKAAHLLQDLEDIVFGKPSYRP